MKVGRLNVLGLSLATNKKSCGAQHQENAFTVFHWPAGLLTSTAGDGVRVPSAPVHSDFVPSS